LPSGNRLSAVLQSTICSSPRPAKWPGIIHRHEGHSHDKCRKRRPVSRIWKNKNAGPEHNLLISKMLRQGFAGKNLLSNFWNSLNFVAIAPVGAGVNRFFAPSAQAQTKRKNIKQTTSEEPDEV